MSLYHKVSLSGRSRGLQAGEPVQALPPGALVIHPGHALLQQAPQRLHYPCLRPPRRLHMEPWWGYGTQPQAGDMQG